MPLHDAPRERPDPCVLVIFGASGDLTQRKLVPALYQLERENRLPPGMCVLGVSRTPMTDDQWRDKLREGVREHTKNFDEAAYRAFARRLHYLPGSGAEPDVYPALIRRIADLAAEHRTALHWDDAAEPAPGPSPQPNVLFYLSVAPSLYGPIAERIGEFGLVFEGKRWCAVNPQAVPWQRIIVEKPHGTDLPSAAELNRVMGRVFEEDAIYRIDHYLGKELIQNIFVMRFGNTIFEPLWNNHYVDHVQVTAAESVGVGRRAGNFYDAAGATRDMVQSHLLQVLSLVAMEPPSVYDQHAIRREKIKLVNTLRFTDADHAHLHSVFGRYGPSGDQNDDDGGRGYAQLDGVDPERRTETFAAFRLFLDNWRWAGVPFYVRSGKKMARKLTEIVVQFKQPPLQMFRDLDGRLPSESLPPNRVVINIAPDDGISIRFQAKVPGPRFAVDSVKLDMDYAKAFNAVPIEAYGPLMLDAMRGDQTLYKHRDEVEIGWKIFDPFLQSAKLRQSIETYAAGSWGPPAADQLLARDGRRWHNPVKGEKR
ncbi:MAG: glucose-6-phosphate dehydrogenase [Phycisphaerales bacterium]|nr:glucose-6-phosphate dehydrogenase [Phycisphaerales bacterium]